MASAVEEAFHSLNTTRPVNLNNSNSSSVKSNASQRQARGFLHLRFQKPAQSGPGSSSGRVYDVAVEPGGSGLAGRGTPLIMRSAVAVSSPARPELPRGHAQRPGPLRRWPAPGSSPRYIVDTQSAPAKWQCKAPTSPAVKRGPAARRGKVFRQVAVQSPDDDDAMDLDCDEIELPPPTSFSRSRLSAYCGLGTGYAASSKELQRRLVDSMALCFPKDVWDACEVSHPDEQALKDKARRKSTMDLFRDKLTADRKRHEILHGDSVASFKQEAETGRMLAMLAQESGWQVLDVEEVRDIFLAFAPDGFLHVEDLQFSGMMGKLYSDSNLLEIKQICEEMLEREGVPEDLSSPAGRFDFEVGFCCFFRALTSWLDRQCPIAKGRRCTLSRFSQSLLF